MAHKSMFKRIGDEIAQCVIPASKKELFEKDGFVDHIDKVGENKPKRTPKKASK